MPKIDLTDEERRALAKLAPADEVPEPPKGPRKRARQALR
jgi:hypothetical protein